MMPIGRSAGALSAPNDPLRDMDGQLSSARAIDSLICGRVVARLLFGLIADRLA